jgi:hypothetical protein
MPDRALEHAEHQEAVHARRAARWASWRGLTTARRMQVRVAALALALILGVVLRAWWRGPSQPPVPSGIATVEAPSAPASTPKTLPATSATSDEARQEAARFAADRQRLRTGEWTVLRDAPVFERGPLGAWDDFVVGSPVVMKEESGPAAAGGGMRYRMWYRGCRLALQEHACGVGHAASRDGIVWEKRVAPVFVPADPRLRDGLDEIAVTRVDGRYFLWYSVMADPFKGHRRATLHLATSSEGLAWTDEGLVLDGANDGTVFMFHSVFHDGQTFHLWYTTKVPGESSPVLQHFSSSDGKTWTPLGGTRIEDLEPGPSLAMGRLMIVPMTGGERVALFTHDPGSQASRVLGALRSSDGTNWMAAAVGEDPFRTWSKQHLSVGSLSGAFDRDGLWLWAALRAENGPTRIGVAFRKGASS